MLTQTLRRLESDDILKRTVYPVVPPKTEYKLTAFGTKLIEPLQVLADWAEEHQAELRLICDRRSKSTHKTKSKVRRQKAQER
jgi:DNA-binding HxlR family transcriptional regulator